MSGESIANRDAALECVDIARAALRAGDHARAERFASKALKLYRCQQTESMMLQVQVFISELTRGGNQGASGTGQQRAEPQQQQQQQRPQQQQQRQQQPEQQHTHANGTSTTDQAPRGMGGEGLRQRHAASRSSAPQQRQQQQQQQALPPEDPSVTPEQRRVVARILEAKCYYEVLGVSRDAGDPDIKSAYKKLALRLHPDKNKAHRADEAFKLLSRAFSCLSTPDKRAYYDRTGYESSAAAQAAAASQANARRGRGAAQYAYYGGGDDFDPEEIFNMFFGGGAFGSGTRVYRHFGGVHPAAAAAAARRAAAGAGARPSREEQQRSALLGLMQLLPVLLIVGLTLFSTSGVPPYALAPDAGRYPVAMATGRLGVSYYVKDASEFSAAYPANSHKRLSLERQVESDVYERLFQRCQNERMVQHRAYTWGNRDAARRMELESCRELQRLNEAMAAAGGRTVTVGGW